MRVSNAFVKFFKEQVLSVDSGARIFLFGSRAKDQLRGGDIDLLVISDHMTFSQKLDILTQLKIKFGDQKIDLSIYSHKNSQADPFVIEVLKEAIEL
jgi:predicted nucleotidyltransferase